MSVLSPPRDPIMAEVLTMARAWCHGQVIDGSPAIRHALRVAIKLGEHVPEAPPELVAAALLHDSPYLMPADQDFEEALAQRVGTAVARVVVALHREHTDMAVPTDPQTLAVSAADKMISIAAVLRRGRAASDKEAYWRARGPFIARMPYLRLFLQQSESRLPSGMVTELGNLLRPFGN